MAFGHSYQSVDVEIWGDAWFLSLPPQEKAVFLYLLTNHAVPLSGIYPLNLPVAAFFTGWNQEQLDVLLGRFEADDKIMRDRGLIWVIRRAEFQSRLVGPQGIAHIVEDARHCESERIREEFNRRYKLVQNARGLDILLDRGRDSGPQNPGLFAQFDASRSAQVVAAGRGPRIFRRKQEQKEQPTEPPKPAKPPQVSPAPAPALPPAPPTQKNAGPPQEPFASLCDYEGAIERIKADPKLSPEEREKAIRFWSERLKVRQQRRNGGEAAPPNPQPGPP